MKIYAFFDRVSGLFSAPFVQLNDGTAVRYYKYTMSQAEMVAKDTALYYLGEYNENTGEIKPAVKFVSNYQLNVSETSCEVNANETSEA